MRNVDRGSRIETRSGEGLTKFSLLSRAVVALATGTARPTPCGCNPDRTTDKATSHLTNPAKDAGQVIGYSHSTDEATSHSTRLPAEELLAGHLKGFA